MTPLPTVSVIIPAFNAAAYVSTAIESALAQTHPPLEVVVIDDGSTDDTAEVVSRYPPPVRLLQQANGGPAAARNHGVRESRGAWLGMLDADDSWIPEKLERQLLHTADPRVGLVHACAEHADKWGVPIPARITLARLWLRNCIENSTVLIRREAFESVGGFDEDRSLISVEDYNLWLRLAAAGWELATCREHLSRYTRACASLSNQVERMARAELYNIEKVSRLLRFSPRVLKRKRLAVQDLYGVYLFSLEELPAARRFLGASIRQRPSLARVGWWLATFRPSMTGMRNGRRPSVGSPPPARV